jgi:hypothetical protein
MQSDSIELTMNQLFEIEKMNRVIDNSTNLDELRDISKQLHQAWQLQKAATLWAYRQTLPLPSRVVPECLLTTE